MNNDERGFGEADLRIESRFKNARLYNALHERCQSSAKALKLQAAGPLPIIRIAAELTGVSPSTISNLLNLRRNPYSRGKPTKAVVCLAEFCDMQVDDLFPVALYKLRWPTMVVREVDSHAIISLHEAARQHLLPVTDAAVAADSKHDIPNTLDQALIRLSPRLEHVIRLRFGLDGPEHTLEDIGRVLGVGKERVRQLEVRALRQLRHPKLSYALRPLVGL